MSAQSEPAWLTPARADIGFHETGENRGIERFIASAHTGSLGDAWCAIWTNAKLEDSGVRGTRSPAARSFESDTNFSRLAVPQLGCIVTLWRTSPTSGQGHVGFYLADHGSSVSMLSGNDDDQVEIKDHPKDRVTGYWWPIAVPAQPSIPAPQLGSSRFNDCLAVTLKWEGGNDDDPRDPGGRTSRGILQSEWNTWRQTHPGLPSDVWQAPQDQVVAIYRQEYWDKHHCGEFPAGVDLCVFDSRVLSGGAIRFIQRALGVDDDGVIDSGGPTVKAASSQPPQDVINAICDARMTYLRSLAGWPTYGHGWTNRVEDIRIQALSQAGEPAPQPEPIPVPTQSQLPAPLQPGTTADLADALRQLADEVRAQKAKETPEQKQAKWQVFVGGLSLVSKVAFALFPQIGVWGVVATQALAWLGTISPVQGTVVPSNSTMATTTLVGMLLSGIISRLGAKSSKSQEGKMT